MHHEIPVGKYLMLALMSSWLLEAMMIKVQGNLARVLVVGRWWSHLVGPQTGDAVLMIVPSYNIFPTMEK